MFFLCFSSRLNSFVVVDLWSCYKTGITGVLCSKFCRKVVFTDHNDEVLKVKSVWIMIFFHHWLNVIRSCFQILKKNIELHEHSSGPNPSAGEREREINFVIDSKSFTMPIYVFGISIYRIGGCKARMGKQWSSWWNFAETQWWLWSYSWSWYLYPYPLFGLVLVLVQLTPIWF